MNRTISFTITLPEDQANSIDARFRQAVAKSGQSLDACLSDMICRWVGMMEVNGTMFTMVPGSFAVVVGLKPDTDARLRAVAGDDIKSTVDEAIQQWIESNTGPTIQEGGGWLN